MDIASVLIAYNEPELAKNLYCQLLSQSMPHDVIVLDNSSRDELVADTDHTIDVGRHNLGWGGCHEWFMSYYDFERYDFVGFWNVDVTDVEPRMLENVCSFNLQNVGAFSPSINNEGTVWDFMRQGTSTGLRTVPFLESISWYCRPIFIKRLLQHSPLPFHGWWIDVVACGYVKMANMNCVVCDDVRIRHLGQHKREAEQGAALMGCDANYVKRAHTDAAGWITSSGAIQVFAIGHDGHLRL